MRLAHRAKTDSGALRIKYLAYMSSECHMVCPACTAGMFAMNSVEPLSELVLNWRFSPWYSSCGGKSAMLFNNDIHLRVEIASNGGKEVRPELPISGSRGHT